MTPKEQIVELKCVAPKIEFLIEELDDPASATFFYKRLVQLARKAQEKYKEVVKKETSELWYNFYKRFVLSK